jgi:hypothetical protein
VVKTQTTFTTWLAIQRERDDWIGDIARDVASDRDWPACNTMAASLQYLLQCNACEAALAAMTAAWREFRNRDQRPSPPPTYPGPEVMQRLQ